MTFHLPLADRTFERTQGCWNCRHRATPDESMKHWLTNVRPGLEQHIADRKQQVVQSGVDAAAIERIRTTPVNAPCPCGSRTKYKRCHRDKDATAANVLDQIKAIEQQVGRIEAFEESLRRGSLALGIQGLCTNPRGHQGGGFKAHNFLCDQWSAAQGASIARAGQRADDLPEEMVDKHGDGN